MSQFNKTSLSHIGLLPGEIHLHSTVLVRATSNKLFGFAGPRIYGIQPLSPRYRAHITNQRLLLEIYPYSGMEKTITKWGLKGVSVLMGSFVDTPQAHAQIAVQKMAYNATMDANLAAVDDPNAQYIAIPFDSLTATTFGRTPSYLKLDFPGAEEEIVFVAQLDTEGRLLPKGNIIDNAKVEWGLSREFSTLCQEAIRSYRSGTPIEPEHDDAVNAIAQIYAQYGKFAWVNLAGKNKKSWCNRYIDVVALENSQATAAWPIEVETESSLLNERTQIKWKDYDSVFTGAWYLAAPVSSERQAFELLQNCNIQHCTIFTWQHNTDGLHTFFGLPGLS